jgi:hypothetical protein
MSVEHALLNKLRASAETLLAAKRAAKPSSKSQEVLLGESSAVLMELRGVVAGTLAAHASGEEAVERAKRRLTEADDELRALKYQRGRLQRAISECAEPPASTADAVATEAVLSDVISLEAAVSARRLQQPGAAPPPDVAHQQTLYRLGVERDERVRLHALRDGLVARKASLASAEEKASELKAAVDAQMETVTAAAAALQAELLPMPRSAEPFHPLAPLLPSPLYTLAMTAAAYLRAFEADATLSIVGDVEAAQALAKASEGAGAGAGGAGGAAESGLARHPLQVVISARRAAGTATVTFAYFGGLQLLGAAATPAAADATLRRLYTQLPKSARDVAPTPPTPAGDRAGQGAETGAEADDGSQFPDLRSSLASHRLAAAAGRAASEADAVASLLPARPYRWLQWLGGLGPLLTSTPHPSQLVLERLLKAL